MPGYGFSDRTLRTWEDPAAVKAARWERANNAERRMQEHICTDLEGNELCEKPTC